MEKVRGRPRLLHLLLATLGGWLHLFFCRWAVHLTQPREKITSVSVEPRSRGFMAGKEMVSCVSRLGEKVCKDF